MQSQGSSVLEQFLETVTEERFIFAAENILNNVDDLLTLAQCAQLSTERQFGGAYYQALLWAKAKNLSNSFNGRIFNEVCKELGIKPNEANKQAEFGLLMNELSKNGTDITYLQRTHNKVLQNAQRQKERTEQYLKYAIKILSKDSSVTPTSIHRLWCKDNGSIKANLDIIKPSDWWAFGHPKWRRDDDFPGSIPGEIYANALYYFAPLQGIAVDPMAGSGMLKRVYDDRELWQKDRRLNLELHLYDLHPKRDFIRQHDAREPLPTKADWIFLDPPYYNQSEHLYNGGLATAKNYKDYLKILDQVINSMVQSLNSQGRLCLLLPKWSGQTSEDPNYNIPTDALEIVLRNGLKWVDFASVSRGRQQELSSARLNARAKRQRRMRSDTCILNVFEKP